MKKVLIAVGVLAVVVVIVVIGLSRRQVAGENVYAAEATRGRILTVVTGTGVIQPRTKVNISSEIYGQIVDLPVKEGQRVAKGELLVYINPDKYQSEADRLAANLRVSRIAIESEEVNLKNLEREQARAVDLHRQGILAISDKEHADLAVDTARIQIKSLKESVSQAEAALDRAMNDLTKTKIYAPMAGQITQVNTEVGEQVIVGTTNIPGSVLMVISDMSEVLAEVSVDETQVVRLKPGQPAKISVDAVEKTNYEGTVEEVRNTAKKEGDVNVFGVKILLAAPDERLRPGMTAKAKIEVDRRDDVLRVPIQAVTTRERKKLEDDRKAAGRPATPVEASGEARAAEKTGEKTAGPTGEKAAAKPEEKTPESGGGKADLARDVKGSGPSPAPEAPGAETAAKSEAKDSKAPASGAPQGAGAAAKGERDEIEVVYVMDKGIVRAVPVTTGASDDTWVEIKEGVKQGEMVVKGPYRVLRRLKEGDRVVRKEENEAATGAGGRSGDSDSTRD